MIKNKIKIRIKKDRKHRAPHRPTLVHRDKTKYTRKGRVRDRRRRALLKEWQQTAQRMNSSINASEVFSLWLMPGGHARYDLQKLITDLSVQYATPKFEPHVTLIGELAISEKEAVTKTQQLAKLLRPFTIALREVAYLNEYFRCVFIKAEKTPDLLNANLKACEVFEQRSDKNYMPHLSLVYGDLTLPVKTRIIKNIGQECRLDFEVKSIALYYTNGQPQDWYPILETSFGG